MKITKVTVQRGKKIFLGSNQNMESYDIQMEAQVEEKDDPQELVHALRSILDKHLASWEYTLKEGKNIDNTASKVKITTANDLISNDIPIIEEQEKIQDSAKLENQDLDNGPLICPKCNEVMQKKEGKDYYLCSKHWGYPDMIKGGQVREKRF